MRPTASAIVFIALLVASPAASADQKTWDQAAVTELAQELAQATASIRRAARASERPGPGSGLRTAHLQALDDLRRLEHSMNRLARQLQDGVGREETYPTFRRVWTLRGDLARTARRFIRDPAPSRLTQVQSALDELARFYAEAPLA